MLRGVLLDVWPLALALLLVCGALATLVRLAGRSKVQSPWSKVSGARSGPWTLDLGPWTLALHGDERGSVQSLSFVLTVPVFIMLMLLAVQITQLMIGLVIVHYAAFAAARAATVWIPARMEPGELENRIGQRTFQGNEKAGEIYQISPGSNKFERIRQAAALACVPIAPSRNLGLANPGDPMAQSLVSVFTALSPTATTNPRIPQRLANKWAYANLATNIELRSFHRRYGESGIALWDEPPLWDLESASPDGHFKPNEIGWRDQIRVTVIHQFALLPGPGRLLARRANESRFADAVSPKIQRAGNVYFVPLSATATMVGEGEKSVRPYVYSSL